MTKNQSAAGWGALAIGCLASMIAMLLHSLVDFNMYVPANGMVFAWVAGIASMHAKQR